MDRRRHPRVSARLPVRIWGMDVYSCPFMQLATAVNISRDGALIQGMRRHVRTGEVLEVQLGHEKAQFSVTWVGKLGSRRDGEIGVKMLPSQPCIWDVNLSQCVQYALQSSAPLTGPAFLD
jgi:hypothetical protein